MPDPPATLVDSLRDRYTIERELGRGGMATVYMARDLKHDRLVALKVLHPELGTILGAERFEREIRTAARLHHPHILQLHDSGEAAGLLYYTMPYVDGESLRERISRDGPLPSTAAVRIACEVAQALDYAHRHGVVHRDVKPENILLTDGGALVADFGIARAIEFSGDQLTQTGLLVGTPAYMSPEQVAGSAELDGRSDQYSLACVVYEALVGEPLFTGPTAQALMSQRFHDLTPRLAAGSRQLAAIGPVLARALASEPGDRFTTAADFAEGLENPVTAPARSPPRGRRVAILMGIALVVALTLAMWRRYHGSIGVPRDPNAIAVLPFRVADPALALWREGLVDLFATNLDGAASWRTIHPRTALSRWHRAVRQGDEGDEAALLQVARQLGAGYALTGSLTGGSRVRLSLELHPTSGGEVRRVQAEGAADSIPGMVDQLSVALIGGSSTGGSNDVGPSLSQMTTTSLPALKAYLAGEQKFRRARPRDALPDFRHAVELDSTFALAFYRLSAAEHWTRSPHYIGPDEHLDRAMRLVGRLPRRDALLVRGAWEASQRWPEALSMLAQLTDRYPDDAEAWFVYGDARFHLAKQLLQAYGPFREALARSAELDPGFAPAYLHLTEDAFGRGDSAAARSSIEALQRIDASGPKAVGLRAAYDLVWGSAAERNAVRARLQTVSTDALLTGKHAINFAPELAESTLVLAHAIADDPKRPLDDRINAEAGVLWAQQYRGQIRAAIATADTIADWASRASPSSQFAGWTTQGRAWPAISFLVLGYAPDTAALLRWARQSRDPWMAAAVGAVAVRLNDPLGVRRSREQLRSLLDTISAPSDSLERAVQVRTAAGDRVLPQAVLAYDALQHADTARALRLFQVAADSFRVGGGGGSVCFLDWEIGKLLLAAGKPEKADPYLVSAADEPWFTAPAELYLGLAAERSGNVASARDHYGRLRRWWRRADPELRGWLEEADLGLDRINDEKPTEH
jgi:eukaryotic-like serine/threonine-protein kinase